MPLESGGRSAVARRWGKAALCRRISQAPMTEGEDVRSPRPPEGVPVSENFAARHIGLDADALAIMLGVIGVTSLDELAAKVSIKGKGGPVAPGLLSDVTAALTANAVRAVEAQTDLLGELLFKYADGYINKWTNTRFTSSSAGGQDFCDLLFD